MPEAASLGALARPLGGTLQDGSAFAAPGLMSSPPSTARRAIAGASAREAIGRAARVVIRRTRKRRAGSRLMIRTSLTGNVSTMYTAPFFGPSGVGAAQSSRRTQHNALFGRRRFHVPEPKIEGYLNDVSVRSSCDGNAVIFYQHFGRRLLATMRRLTFRLCSRLVTT